MADTEQLQQGMTLKILNIEHPVPEVDYSVKAYPDYNIQNLDSTLKDTTIFEVVTRTLENLETFDPADQNRSLSGMAGELTGVEGHLRRLSSPDAEIDESAISAAISLQSASILRNIWTPTTITIELAMLKKKYSEADADAAVKLLLPLYEQAYHATANKMREYLIEKYLRESN